MKKRFAFFVALLSIALTLTACGGSNSSSPGDSADSKETFVIKAADGFPTSHIFAVNALQPFMKGVEEATGGRVKFEYYPAGQLGKQEDMLELLKSGVADFAMVGPSYMSGKLPLSSAFELPGAYPDAVVASEAMLNLAQNGILYEQEFSKHEVFPVLGLAYSPYNIAGNKQIKSVADVKGLAVRGAGISMELAVSALGGTLANIMPQELYEAMLRGTVDAAALPIEGWNSYKLQELVKYGTTGMNLTGWVGVYCFSDEAWNQFPDDIKAIIIEEGKKATNACGNFIKTAGESYQKQFEKEGIIFNELSDEAKAEFKRALQPVEDQWVKTMNERGFDGKAVLDAVKAEIAAVDAKHNKK